MVINVQVYEDVWNVLFIILNHVLTRSSELAPCDLILLWFLMPCDIIDDLLNIVAPSSSGFLNPLHFPHHLTIFIIVTFRNHEIFEFMQTVQICLVKKVWWPFKHCSALLPWLSQPSSLSPSPDNFHYRNMFEFMQTVHICLVKTSLKSSDVMWHQINVYHSNV